VSASSRHNVALGWQAPSVGTLGKIILSHRYKGSREEQNTTGSVAGRGVVERLVVADRAVMAAARHAAVGDGAALAYPSGEPGHGRDRVVGATAENSASSRILASSRQKLWARSRYSGLQRVGCPGAFMFDPFEQCLEQNKNAISATLVEDVSNILG
jgi:hypothetical protein